MVKRGKWQESFPLTDYYIFCIFPLIKKKKKGSHKTLTEKNKVLNSGKCGEVACGGVFIKHSLLNTYFIVSSNLTN